MCGDDAIMQQAWRQFVYVHTYKIKNLMTSTYIVFITDISIYRKIFQDATSTLTKTANHDDEARFNRIVDCFSCGLCPCFYWRYDFITDLKIEFISVGVIMLLAGARAQLCQCMRTWMEISCQ